MRTLAFSVLIDTYNHERHIEQAVVSAIEQDYPASEYEIVVVDDGSIDGTPDIVRKFEPRVRLLTKKNGGQASAFNAAFPELRGKNVAFLDGDDRFARSRLTTVAKALEQHPEAAAIGHGYYEIDGENNEFGLRLPAERALVHLATAEAAWRALPVWDLLLNSAMTVRRTVLERCGPIPESLVICGDAPIIATAMTMGLYMLDEPLSYYRRHAENLYAVDPADAARARRKYLIDELTFEQLEILLRRLGVPRRSAEIFLYSFWVPTSRQGLSAFGGSRLSALRTEMRAFRLEYQNPSLSYRLFKYLVVGGGALALRPSQFYRLRQWYGQRNLGRVWGWLGRNKSRAES